jgi:hypothetical protein
MANYFFQVVFRKPGFPRKERGESGFTSHRVATFAAEQAVLTLSNDGYTLLKYIVGHKSGTTVVYDNEINMS